MLSCHIDFDSDEIKMKGPKPKPIEERFWSKVNKTDTCWLWTAGTMGGYGRFIINHMSFLAPRVSWELEYGPIPRDKLVCHTCDNPLCVNPGHLFLGSHQDNADDRSKKHRTRDMKLTDEQVINIRSSNLSSVELGKLYGVSQPTISQVIHRFTYRLVSDDKCQDI